MTRSDQKAHRADIRPLPSYLVKRFKGWQATQFEENRSWFQHLAEIGQHPRAMIISCCDSRVHAMTLFGAESGEFFIHRNIANLIPPYNPSGDHHGTSAAIEYAVTVLRVAHIIILGHSNCGGIHSGFEQCHADDDTLLKSTKFIGKWLQILRPAFDRLNHGQSKEAKISALEKESILVSMDNLSGFPFIKDAMDNDRLTLHGLWHDIGAGELYSYNSTKGVFAKL